MDKHKGAACRAAPLPYPGEGDGQTRRIRLRFRVSEAGMGNALHRLLPLRSPRRTLTISAASLDALQHQVETLYLIVLSQFQTETSIGFF